MASPAYRSITATGWTNATTTGTPAVTKPSGTASGDALVFYILMTSNNQGSWPTVTWPSGFTQQGNWVYFDTSKYNALICAVKAAGSSEPASYQATWASHSTYDSLCGIVAISGVNANSPVDDYDPLANNGGATIPTPVSTATVAETLRLLILTGSHGSAQTTGGTIGAPTGYTKHTEHTTAEEYGRAAIFSKSFLSAGLTDSLAGTIATGDWGSQVIALLFRPPDTPSAPTGSRLITRSNLKAPTISSSAANPTQIDIVVTPNSAFPYDEVEVQRSASGSGTWTTIQYGTTTTTVSATGLTPQSTYLFRARTRRETLWSPYSSTSITSTPAQPGVDRVLSSRFSGLNALVSVYDYGQNHEYRFDGTDSITGQVFSATSPRIWGSESGPPRLQILGGAGRDADSVFSTAFGNDGSPYFQVTRLLPYVGVPQAAYRLYPNQSWQSQGMVYHRMICKWDATFPTDSNGFHVIFESKLTGGTSSDAKIELAFRRDGNWRLVMGIYRNGVGASNVWGTGGTPDVNSSPVQSEFYQSGDIEQYISLGVGAYDASGAAPDFSKYFKFEMAYRLRDTAGNTLGNTGSGWAWVATATGNTYAEALAAPGQQRFYVTGDNVHETRTGQGIWLVFPFNYYTDFAVENKYWRLYYCEVDDGWPADASSHPAEAT